MADGACEAVAQTGQDNPKNKKWWPKGTRKEVEETGGGSCSACGGHAFHAAVWQGDQSAG